MVDIKGGCNLKISEIKATFYDLISYFLSGLLFLLILFITSFHYKNSNIDWTMIKEMGGTIITLILFVCYIIGHLLSTLSSLIIEKWLLANKIKSLIPVRNQLYGIFLEKYNELFKCNFNNNDFRLVICYVESLQPNVYSTAFIFLSVYGMCRNFSLIFLSFSIIEVALSMLNKNGSLLEFAALYCLVGLIFLYGYFRFFKYFKQEIINGFILP